MDSIEAYSIYEGRDTLRHPCVLYKEYNGFWSPISALYWSTSSRILVSRHPFSCIEEIISQYCPQCLSRYMEAELRTSNKCPACFQCPCCSGVLRRGADASRMTFTCTGCGWENVKINETLNSTGDSLFNDILKSLKEEEASNWSPQLPRVNCSTSLRWKMTDLESSLQSKSLLPSNLRLASLTSEVQTKSDAKSYGEVTSLSQRLAQPGSQSVLVTDLEPIGFRLRSKRTLRCRRDVEEGKMSILVQPKLFPLEGDSSQKLQRGKWFVKDSSAIHEVLSITITRLPVRELLIEQKVSYFHLTITNPKDYKVGVRIAKGAYPSNSTSDSPLPDGSCTDSTRRWPFSCSVCELQMISAGDIVIDLGAFEDELLRDDDDDDADDRSTISAKSSENAAAELSSRGWSCSVSHNVAHLVVGIKYFQLHTSGNAESKSLTQSGLGSGSGLESGAESELDMKVEIEGSRVHVLPLHVSTEALEVSDKERALSSMSFETIIACPSVFPLLA